MSLKIYFQIIPSFLRHTDRKQVLDLRKYGLVSRHTSYPSIRTLSTKTVKDSPTPTTAPRQVYYGILTPQIRGVKIFSLLTSFTGIAVQPLMYNQLAALDSVPLMVAVCSCVGFFTIVTPFLLHLIAKKYVTSLVFKPETGTYVATTLNLLNIPKELEFTPDDVKVPDVPGMFTSFLVKGTPLFVDPRLFKEHYHYGKLMGYDKPLDLKLFQTSHNEKKQS